MTRSSFRPLDIPLTALSSLLLVASFPNLDLSILAWVALVPLFFLLDGSSGPKSLLLSFAAGALFFGSLIYWLTYVTKLGYVILIPVLALFFALFGVAVNLMFRAFRGDKRTALLIISIPSLWVGLEYIRGTILTGFPWAMLGYTQYKELLVIQIADITGTYGISFIIVMVNVLIYKCLAAVVSRSSGRDGLRRGLRAVKTEAITTILVLSAVFSYGLCSLRKDDVETGVRFSVVQGNIPQEKKWDPAYKGFILNKYEKLTGEASADKTDLIIWPETSVPGYLFEDDIYFRITDLAKKAGVPLFLGVVRYVPGEEGEGRYYNTALLISERGAIEDEYHKIHLVPFGEYTPFEKSLPFVRDFIDVPIGDFSPGGEYTLFDVYKGDVRLRYAALICFEDIFPALVRAFAREGADVFVNMTNDAWFERSSAQLQHAQASVLRAVENRLPVVRAANTGYSCYISPKGAVQDALYDSETGSIYIEGHRTFDISTSATSSFYTRFGDVFAYLCVVVAAAVSLIALRKTA